MPNGNSSSFNNGMNGGPAADKQKTHQQQNVADRDYDNGKKAAGRK